uniref:Uncharacterized protein n=1 Tax=Anopheles atroparvus TaxID=41427 RepID=A0A182IWW9_ANOAO
MEFPSCKHKTMHPAPASFVSGHLDDNCPIGQERIGTNQPLVEPVTRTMPSRKKHTNAAMTAFARPDTTIAMAGPPSRAPTERDDHGEMLQGASGIHDTDPKSIERQRPTVRSAAAAAADATRQLIRRRRRTTTAAVTTATGRALGRSSTCNFIAGHQQTERAGVVTFHWSPAAVGSSSRPSWTTVSSELTTEKTQPPELDCGLTVAMMAKSCRWSERMSRNGDFRSASLVTPNAGNPSSPSTNLTPFCSGIWIAAIRSRSASASSWET